MIDRARIDRLLERLLELPTEERAAALAREVESESERLVLERLLAASENPTEPELGSVLWQSLANETKAPGLAPGTSLGAYRIVSELGRGGMAVVYLAERADQQFEQQVAIKILERPASDELAVRRFHLERQILASLEHPNIARLMDGGIAPDGRPYFVMERVDGLPIDRYCDEHQLNLRQRLELFMQVGRAVAAAHRQLIVHRDLKPSNILVSKDGVPKLLDFGIAKLVEGDNGELPGPALTRTAVLVLTPEYASPEQRAGRPVTTASDVYQLGILLFELLSGVRAFRFAGSTPRTLAEPENLREPTRPSTAAIAAAPGPEGPARARVRGFSSLAQLKKALLGDLDTVVLAAMRPEAERRYESVSALVADVERTLGGWPILARRPSFAYRSSRFVTRHRWALGAAALAMVAAITGTVFHTLRLTAERDRAEREAVKASKIAEFLVGVFQGPNAREGKKAIATTALEVAERGAKKLEADFDDPSGLAGQPEVRASLLFTLGRVYSGLFEYERAHTLLDQAIELQRRVLGDEAAETLRSLDEKAALCYVQGNDPEALELYRQVAAGRERTLGPNHPLLATTLYQMSVTLVRLQRFEEALEAASRALAILELQQPPEPELLFRAHQAVAVALGELQRGAEALPHHRLGLELLRQADPHHPYQGTATAQYASQLQALGQLEEARSQFAEALRLMDQLFGLDSPRSVMVLIMAADAEVEAGNAQQAIASIERAITNAEKTFPPTHLWHGVGRASRAYALQQLGRNEEALTELARAREILAKVLGESSNDVLRCDLETARLLFDKGESAAARTLLIAARDRARTNPHVLPKLPEEIDRLLAGEATS